MSNLPYEICSQHEMDVGSQKTIIEKETDCFQ